MHIQTLACLLPVDFIFWLLWWYPWQSLHKESEDEERAKKTRKARLHVNWGGPSLELSGSGGLGPLSRYTLSGRAIALSFSCIAPIALYPPNGVLSHPFCLVPRGVLRVKLSSERYRTIPLYRGYSHTNRNLARGSALELQPSDLRTTGQKSCRRLSAIAPGSWPEQVHVHQERAEQAPNEQTSIAERRDFYHRYHCDSPDQLQDPRARIPQNCCRDCRGKCRANSGCWGECWGNCCRETTGRTALALMSKQRSSLCSGFPSTPPSTPSFLGTFPGSLRSNFGEFQLGRSCSWSAESQVAIRNATISRSTHTKLTVASKIKYGINSHRISTCICICVTK